MEREMYQAKRARDQQLNETRKEVERRKEPSDRTERRVCYVKKLILDMIADLC